MSVITRGASLLAGSALAVGAAFGMPALAVADDYDSSGTRVTEEGAGGVDAQAVYKNVWKNSNSYSSTLGVFKEGTMYAGSNYFYCQSRGLGSKTATDSSGRTYINNWWLRTDDDSGNRNVWVNAVNISGGSDNSPVPGVPYC